MRFKKDKNLSKKHKEWSAEVLIPEGLTFDEIVRRGNPD